MNTYDLHDAIGTRINAVTNATGYFGRIGRALPGAASKPPADPPLKADGSGRVTPYFILYGGALGDLDEAALCGTDTPRQGDINLTAAAGELDDLVALVDRLHALLRDWHVDATTKLTTRPGYSPPVLVDEQHSPARLYTPLQYQATTT